MSSRNRLEGCLTGVGVGPGDPELLTLKAARLIQSADVISYLCNAEGHSQSLAIIQDVLVQADSSPLLHAVAMPMSLDRRAAHRAYDRAADELAGHLHENRQVVFLCEGDPLFFGSFAYLLDRLSSQFRCDIVPGISSVNAASAALKHSLVQQEESCVVISGRQTDAAIRQALESHATVVIMKAGLARVRILDLLEQTGRLQEARYLEYIGRENQLVIEDVRTLGKTAGPYFSLFVVSCR